MVAWFGGSYYWYGTSYGCGFSIGSPTSKFCGVVVYRSASLHGPWAGPTLLFDPAPWQARCAAPNYGCFRPHVVFNPNTNDYRLWLNVAATTGWGYAVFSSASPAGPFSYVGDAVLTEAIGGTPKYGDLGLYVDNGIAYVAYTVIGPLGTHAIAVERLDAAFVHGTGAAVMLGIRQWVEAPSIFKRGSDWYVLYSDPICSYCRGTGTSYAVGVSPLGPWSELEHNISATSCGGQPSAVSLLPDGYLYQSDLWLGTPNETAAFQHWEWLAFTGDGTISGLRCQAF